MILCRGPLRPGVRTDPAPRRAARMLTPETTVLITGAAGQLAGACADRLAGMCRVEALDRRALDITSPTAVLRVVERLRPALVLNCAAYNDVDGAESHAAAALAVNALGVRAIVAAAAESACRVVHYSTDFVFDGEATRPYTEADEPHPHSFYGLSKLLGEWLAAGYAHASILRVESLFGAVAPGAVEKGSVHGIVKQIEHGDEVPVFADRTVSPSYTADIARATRALLERGVPPGLYHCVNSGAGTWAEIAEEAGRILGRPPRIKPITLQSANLKAPRPRYCAMSNARLASHGIVMPTWQDALRRYLARARSAAL
jgi:dTDP-4-dehydrorhamnose reductase